jgi:hypothetical protein
MWATWKSKDGQTDPFKSGEKHQAVSLLLMADFGKP